MSTATLAHRRAFSIWMLVAPALLLANPWGSFDWVELTASTGPWVLGMDRRVRPFAAIAVGLVAIAFLGLTDGAGASAARLLLASAVFVVGVLLAARAIGGPERVDPLTAGATAGVRAAEEFQARLEREFGRARRHAKGLALLSINASPRSPGDASAERGPAPIVSIPRDADSLEAVRALLARELRLYSDVVVDAGRVLALVPEVESGSYEAFVARVRHALAHGLELEVQIGAASFPKDAVCVEALVEAADRDRAASKSSFLVATTSDPQHEECEGIRREGNA